MKKKRKKQQGRRARKCGATLGCERITMRDVCDNCRAARLANSTVARLLRSA